MADNKDTKSPPSQPSKPTRTYSKIFVQPQNTSAPKIEIQLTPKQEQSKDNTSLASSNVIDNNLKVMLLQDDGFSDEEDNAKSSTLKDISKKYKFSKDNTYEPLLSILQGQDYLNYLLRFCYETDKDKREQLLQHTIIVYRFFKKANQVLKHLIAHEVKSNGENGFRFLHVYNRMYFSQYLKSALQDAARASYDIIQQMISAKDQKDQHLHIILIAKLFLGNIQKSLLDVPNHLSQICHHMLELSKDFKPVGDVIFRHFFVPAIVFPETCALWPTGMPNAKERAVLVNVSKLLQKIATGGTYVTKTAEANAYNEFISEQQAVVLKFMADVSVPRQKEDKLSKAAKRSSLKPISESDLIAALSKLYTVLSQMFGYFPLPTDIMENSYLHIVRTEEICDRIQKAASREDFIDMMERFGTIIVPIEWVFHKKQIKLSDMGDVYSQITEDQINKDLKRDKLIINGKITFENSSSTEVLTKLASLLLENQVAKDATTAKVTALSVLQTCGRTSSAGDALDVLIYVFGKCKLLQIVAEPGHESEQPIMITVDKHTLRAEQTNTFRIMDHYYENNSVWCRIAATTKWHFVTGDVSSTAKQQLKTGIVVLEYAPIVAHLNKLQLVRLQTALYKIYKLHKFKSII